MEVTLQTRHGVSFYACSHPSWAGTAHGFSTRLGGVSPAPWDSLNLGANRGDDPPRVAENFHRFCAAVGADAGALIKNHQVHGALVRPVTRADILAAPEIPGLFNADGLITDEPGLCLTVFFADCTPILFYDPVRRCIAAVHAGWRGTAAGIAARAAESMIRDYGCRPEHILACVGPCISACCFETHADVPDGLLAGLGSDAAPYITSLPGGEKYKVDLKGANVRWLERAGLDPTHISVCSACTACQPDLFWSHRLLGAARGSMAAVIQLL